MKRFLCISLVVAVMAFFPAFGEIVQLGGIVESYGVTICSLDARKTFGSFTVEFAPAFMTYSLSNPSITFSNGSSTSGSSTSGSSTSGSSTSGSSTSGSSTSQNTLSATGNISAALLQLGAYYNWWKPDNMVVYSGARLGIGVLSGSAVYSNTAYDVSGKVIDIKAVALGWDWKFPGLNNLLFSSSMGIQGLFFPSIDGSENNMKVVINPGINSFSTFLELGTRISIDKI